MEKNTKAKRITIFAMRYLKCCKSKQIKVDNTLLKHYPFYN